VACCTQNKHPRHLKFVSHAEFQPKVTQHNKACGLLPTKQAPAPHQLIVFFKNLVELKISLLTLA